MTTSNRMSNFKRLAERFSQGEKLLTTQEKIAVMRHQFQVSARNALEHLETYQPRFQQVRLVLRPSKKHTPH